MDDTTAFQECGDLSLEIDELSPATQMFLSSSPSLQGHDFDNITPTLSSSIASVQPPPQPLPSTARRSRNEQAARAPSAIASRSREQGHTGVRSSLERAKVASKSKSSSGAKVKSFALAVAAGEHRDSAEFFEKRDGGLLSPPPAFSSSDFLLLPVDDMSQSVPSIMESPPVCTPKKIEAKHGGRNSKLVRPSPNVSLFSGSKNKDRHDATTDASPPKPAHPAVDSVSRTFDLVAALQIGPGKPVPAPPAPALHVEEQPLPLSKTNSSDVEFFQVQQFLASRYTGV
jgi:hypothetical protein